MYYVLVDQGYNLSKWEAKSLEQALTIRRRLHQEMLWSYESMEIVKVEAQ